MTSKNNQQKFKTKTTHKHFLLSNPKNEAPPTQKGRGSCFLDTLSRHRRAVGGCGIDPHYLDFRNDQQFVFRFPDPFESKKGRERLSPLWVPSPLIRRAG
jgi:hypothetical protein